MSGAGKHVEFGDPGNSFFLPYTEVQFELKRLLAGVSRRELRELLRRSESIEPLPAYAYREVRRFLDETIEQDVALQTDPDGVRERHRDIRARGKGAGTRAPTRRLPSPG